MKITGNIIVIFVTICVYDMIIPKEALAYLDPGTGSYIFQLLIAVGLAVIYTLKVFWGNIVGGIRKIFNRPSRHKKNYG